MATNKKSSLVFLSNHLYIPDRAGGLEASTDELCIALKSRGINVSVLCSGNHGETILNDPDPAFGLSVDTLLGYPVYRAIKPAYSLPLVVKLQKADFVVMHVDKKFELADSAKSLGISVIFYLRDVQFETRFWKLRNFPKAIFIANSDFCSYRAGQEFGLKCKTIYPLINAEKYRTTRSGSFITFINPVPKKGVELALRLAFLRPHYQFLFVEGWPLTNEQREHYKNRAISLNNIIWMSNQLDMRNVYGLTKFLIVPSVCEEGWGRVVGEAHISGIPSIVSKRGGLPEAIGDGGFVIDTKDEDGWLNALDKLYNDDEYYSTKSQAARIEAKRENLSSTHIINSFLNLLTQNQEA